MKDFALDEKLANAASRAAGEPVQFSIRTPVVETFRGQIVWEGVVSEFMTAKRQQVYAWAVEGESGQENQYIAVLKQPPVTDALTAVRAWLVSLARK
jgi:hypothetical protein